MNNTTCTIFNNLAHVGNEITSLTWTGGVKCIGWITDEAKSFAYLLHSITR